MTTKQYNKIVIGFVVQRYVDGRCRHQEFMGGDEVSYEDPDSGEPVEVDPDLRERPTAGDGPALPHRRG